MIITVNGIFAYVDASVGQATKESVQHVADIASAATQGNYIGPLNPSVTFMSLFFIHFINTVHVFWKRLGSNAIKHF